MVKKQRLPKKSNPIAKSLQHLSHKVVPDKRNKTKEQEMEYLAGEAFTNGYDEVQRDYED